MNPTLIFLGLVATLPAVGPRQHALLADLRERAAARPLVVAHRGASAACPENTLPAFRRALADAADLVELDFHATRDEVLVCFHDATLARTTDAAAVLGDGERRVRDVDLATLRRLDAGRWKHESFAGTRVPTLSEALDAIVPAAIPLIERKEGSASALIEQLSERGLIERVVVQSFDWVWLAELHRLEPRILTAALGPGDGVPPVATEAFFAALERTGAGIVHWSGRRLELEACAALRRSGQMVCTYTLNDDVSLLGAPALGVQMITTDRPARLRELVHTLGICVRSFEGDR